MTKMPKRPRDTNQLAKLMVDILTGQVEDRERTPEERGVGARRMREATVSGVSTSGVERSSTPRMIALDFFRRQHGHGGEDRRHRNVHPDVDRPESEIS